MTAVSTSHSASRVRDVVDVDRRMVEHDLDDTVGAVRRATARQAPRALPLEQMTDRAFERDAARALRARPR